MESSVSQHIQDCFVYLCITDHKFLSTARHCIKPEYFGSSITENIINVCYTYYDQFNVAPENHLYDEITRLVLDKGSDETELYFEYLTKITEMDKPNSTYVLSRMNEFIKAREWQTAVLEFAKLTQVGSFEQAQQLMMKALKTGVSLQETGLAYFQVATPSWATEEGGEELISLGVPIFGDRFRCKRRQLICVLGGAKGKKSWWLQWFIKQGLLGGLKVLYISHELSIAEIETRFDMMFGHLVSKEQYTNVTFTTTNEDGIVTDEYDQRVGTLDDNIQRVMKARRQVKMFGGKLIIKKYPMASCTMGEIERYLDYLEVFENFVPDIIVNDYPDIMKLPDVGGNNEERDRINEAFKHHKRIADERNILMLVASQTNREGLEKFHISKKHIGSDIRKLANSDAVIAVSQTVPMARLSQMRIFIMGGRSDEDGFGCLVSNNLRIGQVVVDSWWEPDNNEE
jgi:hypothetical protein